MEAPPYSSADVEVVRLPDGRRERDAVAVEEPLEIRIGGRPVAVTMRTPGHDEELALGFCLSEGLAPQDASLTKDLAANTVEVRAPTFDAERLARSFYTTSSCGVCGKGALEAVAVEAPRVESELRVPAELVAALPTRLRDSQATFAATGGLHATGLFDRAGRLLCVREDVGRHNAMDKVVGWAFRRSLLPLAEALLCVSGRLSFELVQKAAVAGCPLLVAVGAPSSLDLELALDELDVGARRRRKPVLERLAPPRQRLVNRPAVVEVALVRGEVLGLRAVRKQVAHAHRDLLEGGEDVELRKRERREPVQPHRVAQRDEVEPTAAPLAARDRAELAAELADPLLEWRRDLARERPLADPGHVRLRDAEDAVDARRADADAGGGGRRDRVRGGDERIRAVVEVEQRRLRALEEDVPAVAERAVDEQRDVADERPQPLRVALIARRHVLEVERLVLVDSLEPDVLLGERDLDLLAQDLRVEDILDADAEPRGLVGVCGPDPAPRRPDPQLAEPPLARAVDREVPGHDQVRVPGDDDHGRVEAAGAEFVELAEQHLRVDDAAGTDHRRLARDDAGRELTELERLAAGDDRVPRVRAALVAADDVRVLRQEVDDLPLALVAPLRADDHGRGHVE